MRMALISMAVLAATSGVARADCYELIGCSDSDRFSRADLRQLSCENLWHVRNRIYDEAGYCFKTARGKAAFDNSDCHVRTESRLKLSRLERNNIETIRQVERQKGCPR